MYSLNLLALGPRALAATRKFVNETRERERPRLLMGISPGYVDWVALDLSAADRRSPLLRRYFDTLGLRPGSKGTAENNWTRVFHCEAMPSHSQIKSVIDIWRKKSPLTLVLWRRHQPNRESKSAENDAVERLLNFFGDFPNVISFTLNSYFDGLAVVPFPFSEAFHGVQGKRPGFIAGLRNLGIQTVTIPVLPVFRVQNDGSYSRLSGSWREQVAIMAAVTPGRVKPATKQLFRVLDSCDRTPNDTPAFRSINGYMDLSIDRSIDLDVSKYLFTLCETLEHSKDIIKTRTILLANPPIGRQRTDSFKRRNNQYVVRDSASVFWVRHLVAGVDITELSEKIEASFDAVTKVVGVINGPNTPRVKLNTLYISRDVASYTTLKRRNPLVQEDCDHRGNTTSAAYEIETVFSLGDLSQPPDRKTDFLSSEQWRLVVYHELAAAALRAALTGTKTRLMELHKNDLQSAGRPYDEFWNALKEVIGTALDLQFLDHLNNGTNNERSLCFMAKRIVGDNNRRDIHRRNTYPQQLSPQHFSRLLGGRFLQNVVLAGEFLPNLKWPILLDRALDDVLRDCGNRLAPSTVQALQINSNETHNIEAEALRRNILFKILTTEFVQAGKQTDTEQYTPMSQYILGVISFHCWCTTTVLLHAICKAEGLLKSPKRCPSFPTAIIPDEFDKQHVNIIHGIMTNAAGVRAAASAVRPATRDALWLSTREYVARRWNYETAFKEIDN